MLDAKIKEQLIQYFNSLKNSVSFKLNLDSSKPSKELEIFLNEIIELSPKLGLEIDDSGSKQTPSFEIFREQESTGIRFAAIPGGHEFNSFILAVLNAGGHPIKISESTQNQIKEINEEQEWISFISLSCQNCPDLVQALNLMSLLNPKIRHTMIDGALFPDEVAAHKVMSVPSVFLNGKAFGQGRMDLEQILEKLDPSAEHDKLAKLSSEAPYDVLIAGGGPAGSAAAIYAARKGLKTGIVADRFGGQVQDTLAIENFISVQATEGPKLVASLENHVKDYEVDLILNQRAHKISKGDFLELELEKGILLKSKSLILATGASWRKLGVPGEEEYKNRGVAYCPHCDGPLYKGKEVAVIGGGNSGVEAALDLAGIASKVTLFEYSDELRADAVLQKRLYSTSNIQVFTSAQTKEIIGDQDKVTGLNWIHRESKEEHTLPLSAVFIQIGLVPNSSWLPSEIETTPFGEIQIGSKGETSMEGVFAAGDVTTVPFKQIIIAMGEGAKASLGAFEYLLRNHS